MPRITKKTYVAIENVLRDILTSECIGRKVMAYSANEERYEKMLYKNCGESGLKLPAVSLGLWHNFGDTGDFENMCKMCFTAFDNGITHFDLANNYGPEAGSAETNFGEILNKHMKPYRDEMIISTKAGYYMWPGPYGDKGSKKYLIASIDQSLKRLKLDYVDVFYHHRPDPDTPLYETMWALDSIVKSGKALYAGLSNYDGETMEKAADILEELRCPFVINQNRYSILDRTVEKNGILSSARRRKKGMIIFSPLAQGLLSERYLNGIPSDSRVKTDGRFLNESLISQALLVKLRKLNEIAARRGQTLAQMALSWVYSRDGITSVLIGASKPEQIIENIRMTERVDFSHDELSEIEAILGED